MHRAFVLVIAVVVCALGISGRAHAQSTTTPDGWVVLGVDEYRALRERASPAPPRPEPPPIDATLTRVDYDLRIDGDTVAGPRRADDRRRFATAGRASSIPAGADGARRAHRRAARADDARQPSRHSDLACRDERWSRSTSRFRSRRRPGGESIVLPPSFASISRATLALPRTGIDVTVTGGFIAERVGDARRDALDRLRADRPAP